MPFTVGNQVGKKDKDKAPVRLNLQEFPGNDKFANAVLPEREVVVPSGRRPQGAPAFEWCSNKFFLVAAEDEDGKAARLIKGTLRIKYEIFDINDDSGEPLHTSETSKLWKDRFFWLQAANFEEDGR